LRKITKTPFKKAMAKENLIKFLQGTLPMPLEKALLISNYFTLKQFTKNDFLLKEGNTCNESYFLEKGILRTFVADIDGNFITTNFYSPNIFVNEVLSFFKRIPSSENIQTLTDCTVWAITYDDLQICFHTIPEFREFGRMMLINNLSNMKNRMLGMIQLTAEKRYENLMEKQPEVLQNAPLKYIATYLGITDSSLSRIRKEMNR
jgi:CRP-like cAMP-binding protein